MSETHPTPSPAPGKELSQDARTAFVNGVKLAVSLIATWGVGLVVRFWLPRALGPDRFGLFTFADGLAMTVLGCASLGTNAFVQKEVPVRPKEASDYYGGIVLIRLLLSALLVIGLLVIPLGQREGEIRLLLLVFGVAYAVFALNATLAFMLQANTTVDELAVANVVTKVVWGLGMAAGLLLHVPLAGLAAVLAFSESLKFGILHVIARKHIPLEIRLDARATLTTVRASLGFYAAALAHTVGARLDIALLGFLAHDSDVGWYGASASLAGITFLLAPLLGSVLMPLMARAYERSPEEMLRAMRRAVEGLIAVTTPLALFLALGADLCIQVVFGVAYAPAAGSLRTLAPLFVLTYLSIMLGLTLVVHGRGWRLTGIATTGILTSITLALVLVPTFSRWLGPGGAGTGMALAAVAKEIVVLTGMLAALGSDVLDKHRRQVLARTVGAALGTVAAHLVLAPLGHWRLAVDLGIYFALAVWFRAVKPGEVMALVRQLAAMRNERTDPPLPPTGLE
ncbi:MAG: oligosaccharide flippase family protein [Acidobacteria bacterium]|nr:oligosaccharide flippase family protein [Acidobacteriota bacterium]